jgi:hypothetical protein
MKFPVKENRDGRCLVCEKKMNGRFICVGLGCMKKDSATSSFMFLKGESELFWTIHTHFGTDNLRDVGIDVIDSKSVTIGQADLYFCRKECLKEFFNNMVDTLINKFCAKNRIIQK